MAMTVNSSEQAPSTTQEVRRPTTIRGRYTDVATLVRALDAAKDRFIVVAPMTAGASIPEGCEAVVSGVVISLQETYSQSGKIALTKGALDRIAIAAGIEWDPRHCRRTDDGSDPLYVSYQAVGYVPGLDGVRRAITGEKTIDLRDQSSQTREVLAKKEGAKTLAQKREFICELAESKAKNRAIRSGLGLRVSYDPSEILIDELDENNNAVRRVRPFVVPRVAFTGRTEDPELKKIFAKAIAARFLGATAALYGGNVSALPAPLPVTPPPSADGMDDEDDDGFYPPESSRWNNGGPR